MYVGELRSVGVVRCCKLSCLPPLTIGLSDSWDFAAQEIARQLGIGANQARKQECSSMTCEVVNCNICNAVPRYG